MGLDVQRSMDNRRIVGQASPVFDKCSALQAVVPQAVPTLLKNGLIGSRPECSLRQPLVAHLASEENVKSCLPFISSYVTGQGEDVRSANNHVGTAASDSASNIIDLSSDTNASGVVGHSDEKCYLVFGRGAQASASVLKDFYQKEIMNYVSSPQYASVAHALLADYASGEFKQYGRRTEKLLQRLKTLHHSPVCENFDLATDKAQWQQLLAGMRLRKLGKMLNAFNKLNAQVANEHLEQLLSKFSEKRIIDSQQFDQYWQSLPDSLQSFWLMDIASNDQNVLCPTPLSNVLPSSLAYARMARFELLNQVQCAQGLSVHKLETLLREVGSGTQINLDSAENIHLRLAFHLDDAQIMQIVRRAGAIKAVADTVPTPRQTMIWAVKYLHPLSWLKRFLRPSHTFIVTAVPGQPATSIISGARSRQGKLVIVDHMDPEHKMHHMFSNRDKNMWRFGQNRSGKIAYIELPFDPQLVKEASYNLKAAQDINDVRDLKQMVVLLKQVREGRLISSKLIDRLKQLQLRIDVKDNGQYRHLLPQVQAFIEALEKGADDALSEHRFVECQALTNRLKAAIKINDTLPNFGWIKGPTCQTFSTIAIHYIAKRHRETQNLIHDGRGQVCTGLSVRKAIIDAKNSPNTGHGWRARVREDVSVNDIQQGAKVVLRGLLPVADDQALASEVMRISAHKKWRGRPSPGMVAPIDRGVPELLKIISDQTISIKDVYETAPIPI